jgi:cell division protein FtsN
MARGRASGSRFGTLLVLAGIGGVLTVTFVAGVWTGRHWPLLTTPAPPPAAVDTVTGKRLADERKSAPSALPALTFYQELKAPLTAPPPPPRPTKSQRPPDLAVSAPPPSVAATPPAAPSRAEPAALPEPSRSDARTARSESVTADRNARYTLQVAAYNARPPADTLRAMLAASGHDARVVEADTGGGVRYRVQVGVFESREAAQEARARLAAERALQSFVTTR